MDVPDTLPVDKTDTDTTFFKNLTSQEGKQALKAYYGLSLPCHIGPFLKNDFI